MKRSYKPSQKKEGTGGGCVPGSWAVSARKPHSWQQRDRERWPLLTGKALAVWNSSTALAKLGLFFDFRKGL